MNDHLIVRLSGANIYQKDHRILSEVNLRINRGEFVYLIGKTGSGKSSLLKTLYGALPLGEGNGQVAGYNLNALDRHTIPHLRRKLGIVFQDFNLLSDRSVEENLRFVLQATNWKDETAKGRAFITNLGNPFKEIIVDLKYQPIQQLYLNTRFIYNNLGENSKTQNWGSNPLHTYNDFVNEYGNYTGQGVKAKQFYVDAVLTYEPWHNIFIDLSYIYRKKKSEDPKLSMKTHFVNVGFRWSLPYRRYEF